MKGRLTLAVEEQELVAKEQGDFAKGRGCRDQILMSPDVLSPDIIH